MKGENSRVPVSVIIHSDFKLYLDEASNFESNRKKWFQEYVVDKVALRNKDRKECKKSKGKKN